MENRFMDVIQRDPADRKIASSRHKLRSGGPVELKAQLASPMMGTEVQ
jgi:hypothetical protein